MKRGPGFKFQSLFQARDSRFEFQTRRVSRFKIDKPVLGKIFNPKALKIQDSNLKQIWIQDSNLNPTKMPEIQDSDLVFKGPFITYKKYMQSD